MKTLPSIKANAQSFSSLSTRIWQNKRHRYLTGAAIALVAIGAFGIAAAATRPKTSQHIAVHTAATPTPAPTSTPSPSPTSTPAPSATPSAAAIKKSAIAAAIPPVKLVTVPPSITIQTLPPTQAQQVEDWFNQYDGILINVSNDLVALGNDSDAGNTQAEIADCQRLNSDTETALHYPAIPNDKLNQDWLTAMVSFQMVSQNYPQTLTDPPNPVSLQVVPQQLTAGDNALNQLLIDLQNL